MKPMYDELPGIQFNVTEWLTAAAPVPESEMARGELVALLLTATLPEKFPAVVGANVTLKEADCPAARVTGSAEPAALNPAPLMLICETDTLELPVFVKVTLCIPLVPVVMLPKLSEEGEAVSCVTGDAPMPASVTRSGELLVLLTRVR